MRIKTSGVYKIINTINNHFYIGSTSDLYKRWLTHKRQLKLNIHYNSYLQNSVNKYGIENFKFIIELIVPENSVDVILKEEQRLLDIHFRKPYCYNNTKGVENLSGEYNTFYGKSHTEKTKKIISEKNKNNYINGKMPGFFGKKHTPETIEYFKIIKQQKYKGEGNPRFDKNIYTFKNLKTDEIFTGTRYQFYTKYNLHRGEVCSIINRKSRRIVKYWILVKPEEKIIDLNTIKKETAEKIKNLMVGKYVGDKHPLYDNTIYIFKNTKTNEIFTGTQFYFCKNYNLNKGNICKMIKRKSKSVKSWIFIK